MFGNSNQELATLLISAEILIACLIVIGIFFWLLRRRHRQALQLERQLAQQSRALIANFLDRELRATQNLAQNGDQSDELNATLTRLRKFWLDAEKKALIAEGTHASDLRQIADSLKASRIYTQLKSSSKTPARSNAPLPKVDSARLDEARKLIDSQQSASQQNLPLPATLPPDATQLATDAIANGDNLGQTVSKLEQELRQTHHLYEQTRLELEQMRAHEITESPVLITSVPRAADEPQRQRLMLDEMRAAYEQGLRELQRLRETNSRQRELILQLEQQLVHIPDEQRNLEAMQLIEKLQLQLRDYDNCTVILEMESESLRERISALAQVITTDDQPSESVITDMDPDAAQQLLKMRRTFDRKGFDMMLQVSSAANLERGAVVLINFFKSLKLQVVLSVAGAREHLWLSSEGAIDSRVRSVLQSLQPNREQDWIDDGDNIIVIQSLCRLHIGGDSLRTEDGEFFKKWLSRTMVIIDQIMNLLDAKTDGQDSQPVREELSRTLSDVMEQHLYLSLESQRTIEQHRQEIEKILAATASTPAQQVVVTGLLDDFETEIGLLTRAAKTMETNLKAAQDMLGRLQ